MALNAKSKQKPMCPKHKKLLTYTHGRFGGYYRCMSVDIVDDKLVECDVTANKSKFNDHFYMTDQETRNARKRAHAAFDSLWKTEEGGTMKRRDCYAWLSKVLDVPGKDCHIQHFNCTMCEKVIAAVNELKGAPDGPEVLPRQPAPHQVEPGPPAGEATPGLYDQGEREDEVRGQG